MYIVSKYLLSISLNEDDFTSSFFFVWWHWNTALPQVVVASGL